jgi:hypothetical protein
MSHYSKLTSVNCPLAAFRIQDKQLSGNISEYYTEVYRYGGKKSKMLCWFRKLVTLLMIIRNVVNKSLGRSSGNGGRCPESPSSQHI